MKKENKDDPPLLKHWKIVCLISIILTSLLIYSAIREAQKPLLSEIPLSECFIRQPNIVERPTNKSLATLMEKIIQCESSGNPNVCNRRFGCRAGMGLCQLIPSTVKYCELKLGKSIDPFDAEDNRECGMWLLENEGTRHWGTATTNWGSWACWSAVSKSSNF